MNPLHNAVKALERRRAVVVKRASAISAKLEPLSRELRQLDEALATLRPMAKATATGGELPTKPDRNAIRAQAEKRWRDGQPPTQIARELEISVGTLYAWKKALGWPKQKRAA